MVVVVRRVGLVGDVCKLLTKLDLTDIPARLTFGRGGLALCVCMELPRRVLACCRHCILESMIVK